MKCHRVNELIELLHPAWQQEPDLNLVQFFTKIGGRSGFKGGFFGFNGRCSYLSSENAGRCINRGDPWPEKRL